MRCRRLRRCWGARSLRWRNGLGVSCRGRVAFGSRWKAVGEAGRFGPPFFLRRGDRRSVQRAPCCRRCRGLSWDGEASLAEEKAAASRRTPRGGRAGPPFFCEEEPRERYGEHVGTREDAASPGTVRHGGSSTCRAPTGDDFGG